MTFALAVVTSDPLTSPPHRQFVEEAALDFARRHPAVVLYVSPRPGLAPALLAEYRECGRWGLRGRAATGPAQLSEAGQQQPPPGGCGGGHRPDPLTLPQ